MSRQPKSARRTLLPLALAALLAFVSLALGSSSAQAENPAADPADPADLRHKALTGSSIQIDPTFPYYHDRSAASIADEIARNGYSTVHYFVVNERDVDGELIDALHDRGIAVWALTLAFGSYSVAGYPADYPSWQQQLLSASQPGFFSFSPWSADYLEFKKASLSALIEEHDFDGIELAESFLPDWNGFTSGFYGDVGPLARAAFEEEYGLEMPEFTDESSPTYYLTDRDRYAKWVDFRVDGVNTFLGNLVNGANGIREARRDILVGTWSLAVDAGPDSVARERELQAVDAPAMITAVQPDIHFIQTNWPDWLKADLPPSYVDAYQPYVEQIRAQHATVPLGIQTDIGSTVATARDRDWLRDFAASARQNGFQTWTGYEFTLGAAMYSEAPNVQAVDCQPEAKSITLHFQKRVDVASAAKEGAFVVRTGGESTTVDPGAVTVDGNLVTLALDQIPRGEFAVAIRHVTDTPPLWVFNKTLTPNTVQPGYAVPVACVGRGLQ
ncbi:MAG: hypothetical protein ACRDO1_13300 [Nocardioidaceae bacterium]